MPVSKTLDAVKPESGLVSVGWLVDEATTNKQHTTERVGDCTCFRVPYKISGHFSKCTFGRKIRLSLSDYPAV